MLIGREGKLGCVYWNHQQDNKIQSLATIAAENSDNIAFIGNQIRQNKKAILVEHEMNMQNFKTLDQKVCQQTERNQVYTIELIMEQVIYTFIEETEEELYDLLDSRLPNKRIYHNIFRASCEATTMEIAKMQQIEYCNLLVRGLPEAYTPDITKLTYNMEGLHIHTVMTIPIIVRPAMPLYRIYNTGKVIKSEDGYVQKTLIISKWARIINN